MDAKLRIDRIQAVQIYECLRAMTGSPSYQLLREEVRKKIEKAWPEVFAENNITPEGETREVIINPREQRSLGEGFVSLFNRKDQFAQSNVTTDMFILLRKSSEAFKIWNWVRAKILIDEVPEFDEPLDDEPSISD